MKKNKKDKHHMTAGELVNYYSRCSLICSLIGFPFLIIAIILWILFSWEWAIIPGIIFIINRFIYHFHIGERHHLAVIKMIFDNEK